MSVTGSGSDLKSQAVRGVRFTGMATAVAAVTAFVQTAVLGRLLGPEPFGLMAMVLVYMGFANLITMMGISEALIQRKDPTRGELASLYWLNVALGGAIFLLTLALTPWLAGFFKAPELEALIPVTALILLVAPFGTQFDALARKELRFGFLAGVQVAEAVITFLVSVTAAAVFGLGVWSLVWGKLAGVGMRTVWNVGYGLRHFGFPGFHFTVRELKGYLRFGLFRVGANAVNYGNSNVDQLLIGSLLGPQVLGYYRMAVNLVLQPIRQLNPMLTRVAFPVFVKIQDDTDRLRNGFLKMIRLLVLIDAPIFIGLAAVAPVAVPLVLGEQWLPAVPLIQILVFYGMLRALPNACGSVIMAKGRADWTFYWNVALMFLIPPVVYLAAQSGNAVTVASALVGLQSVLLFAHYAVYIRNLLGRCLFDYLRAFGVPMVMAVLMGVGVWAIGTVLPVDGLVLKLAVQVASGVILYLLLAWLFVRADATEAVNLALNRS